MLGEETLHQQAMKPAAGRFHPRIGNSATTAPQPEWQERTIVSEYGLTAFAGADASSLHEIRQVTSVDGKKIEDTKKAQAALAKAITATDDARKKQLLKQFEKYGLRWARSPIMDRLCCCSPGAAWSATSSPRGGRTL